MAHVLLLPSSAFFFANKVLQETNDNVRKAQGADLLPTNAHILLTYNQFCQFTSSLRKNEKTNENKPLE